MSIFKKEISIELKKLLELEEIINNLLICNKNVTIKGGVVMYDLSNDKRRATRDLDLDFIRYSLGDSSIVNFIKQLNNVKDEIKIEIFGTI